MCMRVRKRHFIFVPYVRSFHETCDHRLDLPKSDIAYLRKHLTESATSISETRDPVAAAEFFKFPRTHHLLNPGGHAVARDDLLGTSALAERRVAPTGTCNAS